MINFLGIIRGEKNFPRNDSKNYKTSKIKSTYNQNRKTYTYNVYILLIRITYTIIYTYISPKKPVRVSSHRWRAALTGGE